MRDRDTLIEMSDLPTLPSPFSTEACMKRLKEHVEMATLSDINTGVQELLDRRGGIPYNWAGGRGRVPFNEEDISHGGGGSGSPAAALAGYPGIMPDDDSETGLPYPRPGGVGFPVTGTAGYPRVGGAGVPLTRPAGYPAACPSVHNSMSLVNNNCDQSITHDNSHNLFITNNQTFNIRANIDNRSYHDNRKIVQCKGADIHLGSGNVFINSNINVSVEINR